MPVSSPCGAFEIRRIAPPMLFLPNSVPCGPRKHLDALEVDEIHVGARDRAVVDVVDVDTDRRLERDS